MISLDILAQSQRVVFDRSSLGQHRTHTDSLARRVLSLTSASALTGSFTASAVSFNVLFVSVSGTQSVKVL